jgi:microsomal dipeptidase-like Zn-dependent dipeptidase
MYEEILALKQAVSRTGLDENDIEDIFYRNALQVIEGARKNG